MKIPTTKQMFGLDNETVTPETEQTLDFILNGKITQEPDTLAYVNEDVKKLGEIISSTFSNYGGLISIGMACSFSASYYLIHLSLCQSLIASVLLTTVPAVIKHGPLLKPKSELNDKIIVDKDHWAVTKINMKKEHSCGELLAHWLIVIEGVERNIKVTYLAHFQGINGIGTVSKILLNKKVRADYQESTIQITAKKADKLLAFINKQIYFQEAFNDRRDFSLLWSNCHDWTNYVYRKMKIS